MTNRRESQVLAGVLAYLETRGDFMFWRQNTSAGYAPSGQFMRSNMRGVADIVGVLAPTGRFIAIEAKREVGGRSSEDQVRFQKNVEAHGGLYVLANGIQSVVDALGEPTVRVQKERKTRVIPR